MPEVRGQDRNNPLVNALLGHSNEFSLLVAVHDLLRPEFLLRFCAWLANEI